MKPPKKINRAVQMTRQWIIAGDPDFSERIPSQRALAKRLDVSQFTIYSALKKLTNEGVIINQRFFYLLFSLGKPRLKSSTCFSSSIIMLISVSGPICKGKDQCHTLKSL